MVKVGLESPVAVWQKLVRLVVDPSLQLEAVLVLLKVLERVKVSKLLGI
jgi:hypothetical protein